MHRTFIAFGLFSSALLATTAPIWAQNERDDNLAPDEYQALAAIAARAGQSNSAAATTSSTTTGRAAADSSAARARCAGNCAGGQSGAEPAGGAFSAFVWAAPPAQIAQHRNDN